MGTTYYHDPFTGTDVMNAINFNTRLSDLDEAIYNLSQSGASTQITATLGEGVAANDAGYIDLSDGQGYLLDADAATPKAGTIRGFWTSTLSSGNTGTLQINGIMSGFSSLTQGEPVYVTTTAGDITQTRPSPSSGGSQIAIMEMGIAISTTEVYVNPRPIQYHKRDGLADTETLTIVHHDDVNGYKRNIWAYITENIAGAEATGYASSNQDVDVGLRDRSVATYGSDLTGTGTPSTSGVDGSYPIANAFDDSTATQTGQIPKSLPWWIEVDYGANKTIRRYTVRGHNSLTNVNPTDWTFEYYNGSSWVAVDTQSSLTWSAGETKTFDIDTAVAAERWRINISANGGGSDIWITEMEMMEAATFNDGPDKLAQTFTLASETDVESIGLWLKKVGSPTGSMTCRIETVSGSNPTGTLVDAGATAIRAESSLGTSYAETTFTFASPVTLSAGTYAIVLSTNRSLSESDYVLWGADGSSPSYAGGDMRSETSSSWSAESKDAVFSVYEPGTTHPSRVSVDWWSSAYADMVNRYGDGSGSDLDTKTTFKCVRSAGFDDITVVVELP